MFYDVAISIDANTTENSPETEVLKLTEGVITRVEVQFPNGCAGLAHCRILHDEATFLPTNPDGDFASDGHTIVIDEEFELSAAPYSLKAVCWNDDDTYSHTIYIRVGILRGQAAIWMIRILKGIEKFLKMVGIKV